MQIQKHDQYDHDVIVSEAYIAGGYLINWGMIWLFGAVH